MLQTAIVSLLMSVIQVCPSPPVISLNGYANVTVNCKAPYVELGATAWSVCDGDLSPRIQIDSSQVNTSLPGEYLVYYNVADSGGQAAAQVTRRVIVEDNFTLTLNGFNFVTEGLGGENIYVTYWECNRPYDDFGASAWDECDGNLTQSIIVEGAENVLPRELGDNFSINYSVTNSRGETLTAQRYVVIVDFMEPTVSLYGPGQSPARIIYDADEPDPQWWGSAVAVTMNNTPWVIRGDCSIFPFTGVYTMRTDWSVVIRHTTGTVTGRGTRTRVRSVLTSAKARWIPMIS